MYSKIFNPNTTGMQSVANRFFVVFQAPNRIALQSALLLIGFILFATGSFAADTAKQPAQTAQKSQKKPVSKKVSATYNYLLKGQPVTPWNLAVGSSSAWYVGLPDREGRTRDRSLKVKPANRHGTSDAISASWNGKTMSQLYLSAEPIDLAPAENIGALVIDLRVDRKPKKEVYIRMSCGYPCQGEVGYGNSLKSLPTGEWRTIAIPLNCIAKAGADLSRIESPFQIATEGKLALTISDVRVQKLPPGAKGCADE